MGCLIGLLWQMGLILIPSSLLFDRSSIIILPGTCSPVLTAVWRPWGVGSDMASRQASEYKQHSWLTYTDIWKQGPFSFIYVWNRIEQKKIHIYLKIHVSFYQFAIIMNNKIVFQHLKKLRIKKQM
jgi:hypothetical protein